MQSTKHGQFFFSILINPGLIVGKCLRSFMTFLNIFESLKIFEIFEKKLKNIFSKITPMCEINATSSFASKSYYVLTYYSYLGQKSHLGVKSGHH